MDGIRVKMFRAEVKVLDEEKGLVSAVVSTESVDRDGDIIRQAFWNLKNFHDHPILLSSHDYFSLRNVIGQWDSMSVKGLRGPNPRLEGTARLFIGKGNAEADWAMELAKEGLLAFSVGFIPDMDKAEEIKEDHNGFFRHFEFKGQELLEVSAVTVPSNADALQTMAKGVHPVLDDLVAEWLAKQLEADPGDDDDDDDDESDEDVAPKNVMPSSIHIQTNITDEDIERIAQRVVYLQKESAPEGETPKEVVEETAPLNLSAIVSQALEEAIEEVAV